MDYESSTFRCVHSCGVAKPSICHKKTAADLKRMLTRKGKLWDKIMGWSFWGWNLESSSHGARSYSHFPWAEARGFHQQHTTVDILHYTKMTDMRTVVLSMRRSQSWAQGLLGNTEFISFKKVSTIVIFYYNVTTSINDLDTISYERSGYGRNIWSQDWEETFWTVWDNWYQKEDLMLIKIRYPESEISIFKTRC